MEELEKLKDGMLIVRLESDRRKIEALERLSGDQNLSAKERQRITAQLQQVREEAGVRTNAYVRAFRDHYDFSDVVFMYDYQTRAYLEGEVVFFDAGLNDVAGARVLEKPHLILSQGISDDNGARVLEFLTDDLRPLEKPAPRSHFGILSFFTSPGLRVQRINRKLHKLVD